MRRGTAAAIWLGLTALDQGVKALTFGRTVPLIPHVIRVNYTSNTGFSLGLFANGNLAAILAAAAVLAGVLIIYFRLPPASPYRFPLLLMSAGAVSNLIDRIFLGYVRDMLELLFINFYIFNPADVYVTFGALLCAIRLIRPEQPAKKETT